MRLSIKYKLFLAILSAHIVVYVAMYAMSRYNFDRGFLEYISRIEERQVPALITGLTDYYIHTGSWEPLVNNPAKWSSLIRESINIADDGTPSVRVRPGGVGSNDWYYASEYSPARPYLQLLDANHNLLIGSPAARPLATMMPITVWDEVVGYLAITSRQELSEQADLLFAEQQRQSLLTVALVLVVISALVAFPLASAMVRPIHDVVAGTRALTSGNYGSRIRVRSSDEIGQLAGDFNTLAKTLDHNQQARQQWIADISHELRTPLAILRGELESIQDGIRPLTQDSLDSLHQEVVHLNALVNDLHELSLSDLGALVYNKQTLKPLQVLEQSIGLYEPSLEREQIRLVKNFQGAARTASLQGDGQRLNQLFSNLLQNTCRYTEKNGELHINASVSDGQLVIDLHDSGPGVSDENLPRLFDRLFRVENSRNRQEGGSGLGLAICKNVVEAHDGTITADHSSLGGLRITISLPVETV